MKSLQIFKYIRKILPIIIVLCLLATYGVYYKLSTSNTYVVSEVIHYNDPSAEQGLTPTGEKLDVGEIKSSSVVSKVVDKMGLTGLYSVDSLISRIAITPLPDPDKVAQKEAKLEEGEEYIYEPSTFVVSFAATSSEGPEFARTVLDETLDVYFAQYSRKYVNVAPANNTIENLQRDNYDYIEMMELIDTSIEETLATLYQRMEKYPYYRSTKTQTSFSDLADDFSYLQSVKVSALFAKIFKYQLTRDKNVLVSDYTTRIDNNGIQNVKEESIIADVVQVIDAYVKKMRESGNTNISYEYILDNLHERNLQEFAGDQTVTYDELIYSWRDHSENKEHAIIDSAYCKYVIDVFSTCTGQCGGACGGLGKTCMELSGSDYADAEKEVEAEISALIEELTALYRLTQDTNDEYNEYLGASYISVLSSSSVKESINVILYTIIAAIFLLVVCMGGAIVLGRAGDMIHYLFYTDHLTDMGNRAYLDKYLKKMDKTLLDDGTVYCMLDLDNLSAINSEVGRETGDGLLGLFARYLREAFGKSDADFIYNGNGSFVILLKDADYITAEDILRLFSLRLDERDEYENVSISYKIGIAESFRENKTARKLLSEAIKSKKTYTSAGK